MSRTTDKDQGRSATASAIDCPTARGGCVLAFANWRRYEPEARLRKSDDSTPLPYIRDWLNPDPMRKLITRSEIDFERRLLWKAGGSSLWGWFNQLLKYAADRSRNRGCLFNPRGVPATPREIAEALGLPDVDAAKEAAWAIRTLMQPHVAMLVEVSINELDAAGQSTTTDHLQADCRHAGGSRDDVGVGDAGTVNRDYATRDDVSVGGVSSGGADGHALNGEGANASDLTGPMATRDERTRRTETSPGRSSRGSPPGNEKNIENFSGKNSTRWPQQQRQQERLTPSANALCRTGKAATGTLTPNGCRNGNAHARACQTANGSHATSSQPDQHDRRNDCRPLDDGRGKATQVENDPHRDAAPSAYRGMPCGQADDLVVEVVPAMPNEQLWAQMPATWAMVLGDESGKMFGSLIAACLTAAGDSGHWLHREKGMWANRWHDWRVLNLPADVLLELCQCVMAKAMHLSREHVKGRWADRNKRGKILCKYYRGKTAAAIAVIARKLSADFTSNRGQNASGPPDAPHATRGNARPANFAKSEFENPVPQVRNEDSPE